MSSPKPQLVEISVKNGIATLRMNSPKTLNAWTGAMMEAMSAAMDTVAADQAVKAAILTGTGRFYCAGVDLAATMAPMHPRTLKATIVASNQALFDQFIEFPKPLFIAANGPAVGASVTSASICDAIIAHESSYFWTPFADLGIVPEGCSSFYFQHRYGQEFADLMLKSGEKLTAEKGIKYGYVSEVVAGDNQAVYDAAQAFAEEWVAQGKPRTIVKDNLVEKMKQVNKDESVALANAFLDVPFLDKQMNNLYSKGKNTWMMFFVLKHTRPLWSRL